MKILLKLATLFALGFSAGWLSAQQIYIYPATQKAPRGAYQTVSAVINGVNDKTVTWTTDGGTLVGANPSTENGTTSTIALYSTTPGTYHVTATSHANGAVTATATITVTASPTSNTSTYPHLGLTPAMVTAIRAKTTGANAYLDPETTNATGWLSDAGITGWDFTSWNSGTSTCSGATGQPPTSRTGNDLIDPAYNFVRMSVFPNDATTRNTWGCRAHDVWMYWVTNYNSGAISIDANTWSDQANELAVMVDWLRGGGYLTASDITNSRLALYKLAQKVGNDNAGNGSISPTLTRNSSALWDTVASGGGGDPIGNMRFNGNNYAFSRMLMFAAIGLTFDDNTTDDPPLTNTCSATRYQVCSDFTAGSLRAYFVYAVGAPLYLTWAHLEDPTVSWQAYNTAFGGLSSQPTCQFTTGVRVPCFGDGRQGESSEGSWYSYSFYRPRLMLNMLHTAGVDDPLSCRQVDGTTHACPQLSLDTSSFWELLRVSDTEFLTGFNQSNGGVGNGAPSYSYLTTGDSNTYYRQPSDFLTLAKLMTRRTMDGMTDENSALFWPQINTAFGGPAGTSGTCSTYCGFNLQLGNGFANSLVDDLIYTNPASDPVSSPPADPRPSYPLELYNGSFNQHAMLRDSWTTPTLFSYACNNAQINHEHQQCGRFDIYAKGDYITKGLATFTNYNPYTVWAQSSNVAAIYNQSTYTTCTAIFCSPLGAGQFDGSPALVGTNLLHSELPSYAAYIADQSNYYNGWFVSHSPYWVPGYTDVTAASRSLVYLRNSSMVVWYDRAVTGTSNPKAVYLNTTGNPTIVGNQATYLTRSATQKVSLTTLRDGVLSAVGIPMTSYPSVPFASLHAGGTMQATCTVTNADGSTFNAASTPYVAWSTSDNSIATVNSTGLVTGVSAGSVTLNCTAYNDTRGFTNGGHVAFGVISGSTTGSPVTGTIDDQLQYKDWEPYKTLKIAPASNSTSNQFLNVLEWGASGFTPSTATLNQSTAGQTFDCAFTAGETTMLCFMRSWPASFTTTTYHALGATSHYISDLAPNTTYHITAAGAPSTATTDTAGVLSFTSSGTGDVTVATSGTPVPNNPTFTPVAGTYTSVQSVTIATTSPGTIICYNTTGAPQTNGSTGCTTGNLYSSPVTVGASETLYAVAGGPGYSDSPVSSAAYVISIPNVATPTFSPVAGTYSGTQPVSISTTTSGATLCYTVDGSTPTANGAGTCTHGTTYSGAVGVAASETLKAIGSKLAMTDSTVGSAAYVIQAATPSFLPVAGTYTSTQSVALSSATAGATLCYTTDGSTPTADGAGTCTHGSTYSTAISVATSETVKAVASKSGFPDSPVGSAAYVINLPTVATPSASPMGGTYTVAQTVTLSDGTAGAALCYTLDGTTPTATTAGTCDGLTYSTPLSISTNKTLKFLGTKAGYLNSTVKTEVYSFSATGSPSLLQGLKIQGTVMVQP